ncbi:MAG: hypothetical protein AB7S50_03840 [Bacteroidales bacterium]
MLTRIFKLVLIFSFLFLVPLACEDLDALFVNCDDCYNEKPDNATLSIKFTINKENPYVVYTLYSGCIDCDSIIAVDVSDKSVIKWNLETNRNYSVVAEYYSKGSVVYAVDGTQLKTKTDKSSCSSTCYLIVGDELDVRLKY